MCTRNCRQTVTYCMVHCEFLIIKRALWKFTKYFQVLWLRSVKSNGHILFLVLPRPLSVCSFLCDLPSIMSRVTLSEVQGHLSCRGASGLSLGWAFSLHKQLCAPGWLRPHLPSLSPQGWERCLSGALAAALVRLPVGCLSCTLEAITFVRSITSYIFQLTDLSS